MRRQMRPHMSALRRPLLRIAGPQASYTLFTQQPFGYRIGSLQCPSPVDWSERYMRRTNVRRTSLQNIVERSLIDDGIDHRTLVLMVASDGQTAR